MQAVILAAGKSTRAYPLTLTRPKPLLKVANKTLLEHNLDNLSRFVDEVVVVVGYRKGMVKKHIGSRYNKLKITYVEQKNQLGTAHAVSLAESFIKGRFVLMMGDDIYSKEDIRDCLKFKYSILTAKVRNPQNFGVVVCKNGILTDFIEKPKKFVSDRISTALYLLDKKIFHCINRIKKTERNEIEMPDAVKLFSKEEQIHCIMSRQWLPVGYPWDLLKADKALRKEKTITGKNSKICGKVCNSSVGNNCVINGKVKNSIIMDSTFIGKGSIVEDSVIGENVYFKGIIRSESNINLIVNGNSVKAQKLGAIIGDGSRLVNVDIGAGCRIAPNKKIKNRKIRHDIQ